MHRFHHFHVSNAFVRAGKSTFNATFVCKNNPVEKPGFIKHRKQTGKTATKRWKRQKPAACLLINHKSENH